MILDYSLSPFSLSPFSLSFSPFSFLSLLSPPLFCPQYYQLPNLTLGGYSHQINSDGSAEPVVATFTQFGQSQFDISSPDYSVNYTPVTSKCLYGYAHSIIINMCYAGERCGYRI